MKGCFKSPLFCMQKELFCIEYLQSSFSKQLTYVQARKELGTPRGGEFFERGPNFLNYVQHIFPGGEAPLPSQRVCISR